MYEMLALRVRIAKAFKFLGTKSLELLAWPLDTSKGRFLALDHRLADRRVNRKNEKPALSHLKTHYFQPVYSSL